jgi:hypothetical protein
MGDCQEVVKYSRRRRRPIIKKERDTRLKQISDQVSRLRRKASEHTRVRIALYVVIKAAFGSVTEAEKVAVAALTAEIWSAVKVMRPP